MECGCVRTCREKGGIALEIRKILPVVKQKHSDVAAHNFTFLQTNGSVLMLSNSFLDF